ncbi:ribosomal-processing cysteine protease Prp [Enterococcus mediterraneensis]|uniref:ribosomal-processing cysteine protease Prp n=1 Tax=Enterococcus mediterraneensis TaxID=2364791 RepID=UPI000F04A88F|nr:ribosomal-processing cysteine protease Prp [Enterococcus mediterraneensis]
MIKGTFKRNDSGQIVSFTLTGHAEAGPYGSDIVCAGVSALAISAINGIHALAGTEPIVEANESEGGYLRMEVVSGLTQEQTNIEQILLENLLLGLQSIKEENSEYIEIKTIKD